MPLEVQIGDILHAKRQFQQDGENGGVLHLPRLLERGLHQALVAGEHDGRQIEQQALGAGVGEPIGLALFFIVMPFRLTRVLDAIALMAANVWASSLRNLARLSTA